MQFIICITAFFTFFSLGSTSEAIDYDKDIVIRNGLYFKKITDIPLTGSVSGIKSGNLIDGKREGPWREYWDNGQLADKEFFKNQYKSYKTKRCQKFIQSRGKRLKTTKY